jgi:hypothetical protein
MNKLLLPAALFFSAILFSNCNKNDDPPPSPSDYITKSAWRFSSAKASGIDVSAQIPACFKDNTITFVSNGTGTISEGANICVPPSPAAFTWSFQNNGTQINLSTPLITGGSTLFNVVLLNDVSLTLAQNLTIPPAPTPVAVEISFIH